MEKRILRIIKNKDGHGTINYKLSLPKKWIEEMGVTDNVSVEFNNNKIIIYKEETKMKKVKENMDFYQFNSYVENFEREILETEGVVNVLISDLDEEIPFSGGVFRKEYWGKGKRNGTIVRKDLLYTKEYSKKYETDIFEIYEY